MAKLIIECNTNGEAFELINNLLYAINEAKWQAYKDFLDSKEPDESYFFANEYRKFKELGRQISNRARVEL